MADTDAPDEAQPEQPDTPETSDQDDDEELRAAGKKALDAERRRANKAEKDMKALQAELEELRTSQMSESEKAIAEARAEGRKAAHAEVTDRLVRAEIRAAAAGRLADPGDAAALLGDLSGFTVDGEVDSAAISSAIEQLLKDKPYLATNGQRPSPLPGGGATPPDGSDLNAWLRDAVRGRR